MVQLINVNKLSINEKHVSRQVHIHIEYHMYSTYYVMFY